MLKMLGHFPNQVYFRQNDPVLNFSKTGYYQEVINYSGLHNLTEIQISVTIRFV